MAILWGGKLTKDTGSWNKGQGNAKNGVKRRETKARLPGEGEMKRLARVVG